MSFNYKFAATTLFASITIGIIKYLTPVYCSRESLSAEGIPSIVDGIPCLGAIIIAATGAAISAGFTAEGAVNGWQWWQGTTASAVKRELGNLTTYIPKELEVQLTIGQNLVLILLIYSTPRFQVYLAVLVGLVDLVYGKNLQVITMPLIAMICCML
jgi:hypothetical protein